MEAQAAFVRADGAVELHAVAVVDLDLAFVVDPLHAELDDAFRNDDAFEDAVLFVLGFTVEQRSEGFEDLGHALDEFLFPRVLGDDAVLKDTLCIRIEAHDWFLLF